MQNSDLSIDPEYGKPQIKGPTLIGLYIIPESELPKRYFSYSMCFRKEIGAHGINEKGLWRTHQFNKQEMVVICKPEDSVAL